MKKKKRYDPEDDGRVVSSMNVDGMPWYIERAQNPEKDGENGDPEPLSREGRRAFTWGVVKAAMLVAAVFVLSYLAFILFCTNVWFR